MPANPQRGRRITPDELTPEQRAKYERLKSRAAVDRAAGLLSPGSESPPENLRVLITQLRARREAANLSLSAVASISGIRVETLSRLETGVVVNPTLGTLAAYAKAVGCSLQLSAIDPH